MTLAATKQTLRRQFIACLKNIPSYKRRSAQIVDNLLHSNPFQLSSKILLYYSTQSEVATHDLIDYCLYNSKHVFLPFVKQLAIGQVKIINELKQTKLGIKIPVKIFKRIPQLDLVIMPGLAFDREGYRLGHGQGWYDRFIANLAPSTLKIGLCFEEQLIDKLPHSKDDQRIDMLITEQQTLLFT